MRESEREKECDKENEGGEWGRENERNIENEFVSVRERERERERRE